MRLKPFGQMVVGSSPVAATSTSDLAPASEKEFLELQAPIECGFTLKHSRETIRTYREFKILSVLFFVTYFFAY